MRVDPSGLVAAAQRMAAAVADLTAGEPVHPPLAADDTSVGGAARLTAAGTAMAAAVDEQVAALAAMAAQLGSVAAGFSEQEALNASSVAALGAPGQAGVSGWAGPTPVVPPDVRPPLTALGVLPGEVIARLLTAGSRGNGAAFIAGWTRLSAAAEDAAAVLRNTAAALPETWDSDVATPVVRGHLLNAADALSQSAGRACALAEQARAHGEQFSQAADDVPKPAEFDAVNEQLRQVSAANVNGRYTAALAALMAKKAELETRAKQVYARYRSDTEASTAPTGTGQGARTDDLSDLRGRVPTGGGRRFGDVPQGRGDAQGEQAPAGGTGVGAPAGAAAAGPLSPGASDTADTGRPPGVTPAAAASARGIPDGPPGAGAGAAAGGPPGVGAQGAAGPEQAGELAGMLPQMIPTVLGAAGGVVDGAVSTIGKIPEALMQAGSQAAQAATGELSGSMNHIGAAAGAGPDTAPAGDLSADSGAGGHVGGGGGGDTAPAAGAPLSQVTPSTGAMSHVQPMPSGALPPPAEPSGAPAGGVMPMGMPMGAMMGGACGEAGSDRPARPKNLVVPQAPNTESVTGKVTDRIAKSAAAAPTEPDPPSDGDPPREGAYDPLRRLRIRNMTTRREDPDS